MIVLQGARERVDVLQFSPDGLTLVAPTSTAVQAWHDPVSSGLAATLLNHPLVWFVRFTPDGQKLLLLGSRRAAIWDMPAGDAVEAPLDTTYLYRDWTFCDLTPDGKFLVVAQNRRQDPKGLLSCRPVSDPGALVWSASTSNWVYASPLFLANEERFVLFEWRHDVHGPVAVIRDMRAGAVVSEGQAIRKRCRHPVMSRDRRLIAARQGIWTAVFQADDMGRAPVVLRNDNRKEFTGLAFHPSGRFLAATSNDKTVKLYDTTTWAVVEAFNWNIGRLRSVAFSPDGMIAAAGGDKGKIVVWDIDL
jgi:WD40 repeat protein